LSISLKCEVIAWRGSLCAFEQKADEILMRRPGAGSRSSIPYHGEVKLGITERKRNTHSIFWSLSEEIGGGTVRDGFGSKRTKEINKRIAIILPPLETFFISLNKSPLLLLPLICRADKFFHFDVVGEQLMLFSHSWHAKIQISASF
jgi:hypothetical protein